MQRANKQWAGAVILVLLLGVGTWYFGFRKTPEKMPALVPVKGFLYNGDGVMAPNGMGLKTVDHGELLIIPANPEANFVVTAEIKSNGEFEAMTRLARDPEDKKKPGAPEGKYDILYREHRHDLAPPIQLFLPRVAAPEGSVWNLWLPPTGKRK